MNSGAAAQLMPSALDEDAWDDLLSYIEERRVIPIIGPELLQVETDKGPRLLYDWLAEKLAGRLNVDVTELPQPYTLNDARCYFLGARGRGAACSRPPPSPPPGPGGDWPPYPNSTCSSQRGLTRCSKPRSTSSAR